MGDVKQEQTLAMPFTFDLLTNDLCDADGWLVARFRDPRAGQYAVTACNSHDELVEAIEMLLEFPGTGPALDAARKAVAKAKAGARP